MKIYQKEPALVREIFQSRHEKFDPMKVIAEKYDSAKILVPTEKGELTKTAIRKRITALGPKGYSDTCLKVTVATHRVPLPQTILHQMVLDEFYPNMKNALFNPERVEKWDKFVYENVTIPLIAQLKSVSDSKSKEKKTLLEYTNCIVRIYAGCFYALDTNLGHYVHIMDERYEKDPEHREAIDKMAIANNTNSAICAVQGIINAFEAIEAMKSFYMDLVEIIDWYIRVGRVFSYNRVAEELAKKLHEFSQKGEKEKKICIAVYEDNREALEKIYVSNKNLDFVDKGRYQEYSSIESITEAAGFSVEEFFAEKSEREAMAASNGAKPQAKRDSVDKEEYGIGILNDIDELYGLLKPISSSIKIFNIKPNEIKKKKAVVFGKYVAIAAKIGVEWIMLVDSILPGNAIYCWKGSKYLDGLEKFKLNKAYARKQDDIDHKNHRFDKKTVDIYKLLLADKGISL